MQGVFFFHTRKVGLALGVKWGAGVLLAHILDENGHESWSAPVLYKVNEVSLGLLAGAKHRFPLVAGLNSLPPHLCPRPALGL